MCKGFVKVIVVIVVITLAYPLVLNAQPENWKQKAPKYDYSGIEQIKSKATGFFRVEEIDGRWWMIDPNGNGFFMKGVNGAFQKGRDKEIGWQKAMEEGAKLAESAGFNTISPVWANRQPQQQFNLDYPMPFTMHIQFGSTMMWEKYGPFAGAAGGNKDAIMLDGVGWHDLPNVYSHQWEEICDYAAKRVCAPQKNNPWLIGYYIGNERDWGKDKRLTESVWQKGQKSTAKQAWVKLAKETFGTIDAFNKAWNSNIASFDVLLTDTKPTLTDSEEATAFCKAFICQTAHKYFGTVRKAIKKYDPNHMIIGIRQHKAEWYLDTVLPVAGEYFDVFSINGYFTVHPEKGLEQSVVQHYIDVYKAVKRPIISSEWKASGTGFGFTVSQHTYFSLPFMVGSHFFPFTTMINDEKPLVGLVNLEGEKETEILEAAKEINAQLYEVKMVNKLKYAYASYEFKMNLELPEKSTMSSQRIEAGDFFVSLFSEGINIDYKGERSLSFAPVIQQKTPNKIWVKASKSNIVQAYESKEMLVLDVELSRAPDDRKGIDGGDGKDNGKKFGGYKALWRLWFPQNGETWVGSELLSVTSNSELIWEMKEVIHALNPMLGKTEDDDECSNLKGLGIGGFVDPETKLRSATFSPEGKLACGSFRIERSPGKFSRHSQNRQPIEAVMTKGKTLKPEPIMSVHFMYKAEDANEAKKTAGKFIDSFRSNYCEATQTLKKAFDENNWGVKSNSKERLLVD